MDTSSKLKLITSQILRPIVKILLRNHVSVSEFIEQLKELYVDVADRDFAIPNKKSTTSRISVITGLSRKEVLRIKTLENADHIEEMQYKKNKASNVITGWLKDNEFTDERGDAKELPIKGESSSFETLVKRYGGDITTRAVLDELISNGSVKKTESDSVKLLSFGFIPEQKIEKLEVISQCARDFFETANFNLEHETHEARFQRQLSYTELPIEVVNEFKEYSKEKSLEFLFDMNHWLAERKNAISMSDTHKDKLFRVGIGIYYIQNEEK